MILDTELINTAEERESRVPCLTWASLTSSCLYLLTMSLVRFSRKPDTVSNSWSTVERETSSHYVNDVITPQYGTEKITELSGLIYFWHNLCIITVSLFILHQISVFGSRFSYLYWPLNLTKGHRILSLARWGKKSLWNTTHKGDTKTLAWNPKWC